ncbi:MAG: hypothetical protein WD059_09850 [Balneolaceae bacterium]
MHILVQIFNLRFTNILPDSTSSKQLFNASYFFACILFLWMTSCTVPGKFEQNPVSPYLKAVQTFADNVLENGRDTYGEIHSPLFVDGLNVETGEPVRWESDNNSWIISNFASQQNLMRVLTGLSTLSDESRYRQAAEDATEYMFAHHSDSQGLLYWGGHQFVDLETMVNQFEGRPHELKTNFPYYEFMWEVNPDATRKMLRAIWNAHILEWSVLDLNRHGEYDLEMGNLWDHDYEQPKPFFEGRGLTFINAGTDMIDAALNLYALGEEEGAKTWGLRLLEQYVRARHPETGLGVYQFSQPERLETPPAQGPLTGELTFSKYGDRASNQFGEKYGEIALEGNVLWGGRMQTLYGQSPVMLLHLAEKLEGTDAGENMLKWTLNGLKAYADFAYVPGENHFRPMWADGTDLTGHVIPRTGYYGKKGTSFKPIEPDGAMLLAYTKAVRLSDGDSTYWKVVRNIFEDEALGDPGVEYDSRSNLNLNTEVEDPAILVSVLELYRATGNRQFLSLAETIGDNILKERFINGYFQPSKDHIYARLDAPEPLVLLMLEAARQGMPEAVPPYLTGEGSTDGEPDIGGRPTDEMFYEETH